MPGYAWPRMKSIRRVLRYDGLLPAVMGKDDKVRMSPPTFDELRAMKAFIEANRTESTPFDIIVEGQTPGDDREKATATVRRWAEAGAPWWLEAMWDDPDPEHVLRRIKQGPPKDVDEGRKT